ncbi:hypothetical protein FRC12_013962, partial [Ceratobasidium sp. 428]
MLAVAPQTTVSSHVGWERPRTTTSRSQDPPPRRTPAAPSAAPAPASAAPAPTPSTTTTPAVSTPVAPAMASTPSTHARPTITPMQRLPDGTLDLGSYPSTDLLRLLAALLTQITTTNDRLRPDPTPHAPPTPPTEPVPDAHIVRPAV